MICINVKDLLDISRIFFLYLISIGNIAQINKCLIGKWNNVFCAHLFLRLYVYDYMWL